MTTPDDPGQEDPGQARRMTSPAVIQTLNRWIEARLSGLNICETARLFGFDERTGNRYEARWTERKRLLSEGPARLTLRQARDLTGLSARSAAKLLDVPFKEFTDREDGAVSLPPGELDVYARVYGVPRDRLAMPRRPAPDLEDADVRGELAERMTVKASEFAEIVRESGHREIGRYLESIAPWEWPAFAIALAALADPDRPLPEALDWVTWDHATRQDGISETHSADELPGADVLRTATPAVEVASAARNNRPEVRPYRWRGQPMPVTEPVAPTTRAPRPIAATRLARLNVLSGMTINNTTTSSNLPPGVITIGQAAEKLGVSRETVNRDLQLLRQQGRMAS